MSSRIRSFLLCGTVGLAATAPGVTSAVTTDRLVPHRALYEVDLGSRGTSQLADVSGRMMFDWEDACDGWIVEQRYALRFSYPDGEQSERLVSHVSWESKDGLNYRFHIREHQDGVLQVEYSGRAELEGPGQGGWAQFTAPEEEEIALPAGTVFPMAHTIALMEHAERGERTYFARLFDGGEQPMSDVNAVIGRQRDPVPEGIGEDIESRLLQTDGWPIRLAFFPVDSQQAVPDYEMDFFLFGNGVTGDLDIDYSDFSLHLGLGQIEATPTPDC